MADDNKLRTLRAMIIDDFECLISDIDSLIDYYKGEAKRYIDENLREGMLIASERWESLSRYKQRIEDVLDDFNSLFAEDVEKNDQNMEDEGFIDGQNFSYMDPLQIKIFNNYYQVNRKWREVLIIVCEELIKRCPDILKNFDKNDAFKGRKRRYFSYIPEELREARKLSNGLYVDVNLSANSIVRMCYNIIEQRGYNSNVLRFKVEPRQQGTDVNNNTTIEANNSIIKLPPKYSSVRIPKEVFKTIVEEMILSVKENEKGVFNPSIISEKLKDVIISMTDYAVPYYVVNKITNYLVDHKLVEKISNGKYGIRNLETLKSWMDSI